MHIHNILLYKKTLYYLLKMQSKDDQFFFCEGKDDQFLPGNIMHQPRDNGHAEAQQKQQNLKIPFITPPRFGAGLLGLSLMDSSPT